MEPCGQLSKPLSSWGMPDVGRQTELGMDWFWGHDLSCPHSTSCTQPGLFDHPYQHTGSLMLGDKPPGQRSMLHILSFLPRVKGICQEWMAVLSPLPAGLSTCGPRVSAQAWVSASALCLSAPLQCPPAGYVSGPDRLPDSGICLGEQGKGHRVIPHAGYDKPLCFSFPPSLELFAIHDDSHKRFYTACHPGAAGAQHYHTMLSYPREETDTRIEPGKSATARALLQLCSKFFWTPITWRATRRIQIRISHAIFSIYSCTACNIWKSLGLSEHDLFLWQCLIQWRLNLYLCIRKQWCLLCENHGGLWVRQRQHTAVGGWEGAWG